MHVKAPAYDKTLNEVDPELKAIIDAEKSRQLCSIEMIASENFTSRAVMECLGSCLTNKYSEGQPGARYYGGNEHIDEIENLCKKRALEAFSLNDKEWGVNVQPYSGSPANFAVYTALLQPHDRIMGMDLPSGGHLTHGFYTAKKRISATSIYFESLPYGVDAETGLIDFAQLRDRAHLYRPKMIIAGASAYPREIDWSKFREIADEVGAYLMVDMAHISGLVASGLHKSPFEYADIVTTTSHKSLRGPRSGMIFYRISEKVPDMKERIDGAVFPALQGGPHNHQIAALATQFREVMTPGFREYSKNVIKNCHAMAEALKKLGHKLATDGTDNHLVLWDLRPLGITGNKMEKVCEFVGISLNRNTLHGDKSALAPGGVRIGSPAMTTRGCSEHDFEKIAQLMAHAAEISVEIQHAHGKKMVEFQNGVCERNLKLVELRKQYLYTTPPVMTGRRVGYFSDNSFGRVSLRSAPNSMGSYSFSCDHPMDPKRLLMVDSLVRSLGIYRLPNFILFDIRPCSFGDLRMYHSKQYLDFLQSARDDTISESSSIMHNIGRSKDDVDCTAFDGVWDFNRKIAGATLDAAHLLVNGSVDIAINWAGGMHHAKRENAAGFCYINDCVLGILELLKKFKKVLYIDIDFHHGDGVEEAFYLSDQVATVSFHRFSPKRVFPGTGDLGDTGVKKGKLFSVNVPLLGGIDDEQYVDIFSKVVHALRKKFSPDVVVIQCGADSLAGDMLGLENGCFNLSSRGHGECVRIVRDWNLPLLVLGGGGYSTTSVAKCWAIETAILCEVDPSSLPREIPRTDEYFDTYPEPKRLEVIPNRDAVNFNAPGRIEQILKEVLGNIESIGSGR